MRRLENGEFTLAALAILTIAIIVNLTVPPGPDVRGIDWHSMGAEIDFGCK